MVYSTFGSLTTPHHIYNTTCVLFRGADRPVDAKRSLYVALVMVTVGAVLISGLLALLKDSVARLYTDDDTIISETGPLILLLALEFFLSAIALVFQGLLEGAAKPQVRTPDIVHRCSTLKNLIFTHNWRIIVSASVRVCMHVFIRLLRTVPSSVIGCAVCLPRTC